MSSFASDWQWFIWLERIAKHLNCRVSEVYEIKASELLNWMEYALAQDEELERIKLASK